MTCWSDQWISTESQVLFHCPPCRKPFSLGQDLGTLRSKLYLVLRDLLCDLGCLGSHGLSWAQPPLCGAQPFSQWLQRFVELKCQNLQFLQLPLPWRQKEKVQLQHLLQDMRERQRRRTDPHILFSLKKTFSHLKTIYVLWNYLAPALSSKSVHLSASFWSWVSIFSLSTGSAVAAILSPSAWIICTVGRRSSNSLWSSCR